MIGARWKKVLRDLTANKARTVLVVLSIAVGVFTVGLLNSMTTLMSEDMDAAARAANYHSASIFLSPFSSDLLAVVEKIPSVRRADGRSALSARVEVSPGKTENLQLISIPPFKDIRVDLLRPVDPAMSLELKEHEVWLERSAHQLMSVQRGDKIKVVFPDGRTRELRVSGFVHNLDTILAGGLPRVVGFVSPKTLANLGGADQFTQLLLVVEGEQTNQKYVESVVEEVAAKVQKAGYTVYFKLVFRPGEHPVSPVIRPVFALLGGLGFLTVFLSAFLVVNTINALLTQHVRQIGVMKAIGARREQVAGMYIALVLGFGALAFLIAFPLATYVSYDLARGMANYFNFDILSFRIIPGSLVSQLIVALVVPLGAALLPILMGSQMTVREAISNYGVGRDRFGQGFIDRLVERIRFLSRPLLISLRNTFRRKGRLLLTLSTLTLGGAIFISVFNVQTSIMVELNRTLDYFLSDLNVTLNRPIRAARIIPIIKSIPDVKFVEGWVSQVGQLLSVDRGSSMQVGLIGLPPDTDLIHPTISAGRWLNTDDENAVLVGNQLLFDRPDIQVGSEITIEIDKRAYPFVVVGVYQFAGTVIPPTLYTSKEYLNQLLNQPDQASEYRVVLHSPDFAAQDRTAETLRQVFLQAGFDNVSITTGYAIKSQQASLINILIVVLITVSMLIALVGGLGLAGTMSMNVLERTREIGVMRAIGAKDQVISQMVVFEGMMIGVISWGLAGLLSVPISISLNNILGVALLNVPLQTRYSQTGFLVWLILVVIISAFASLLPARSASQLTVREVLAYE